MASGIHRSFPVCNTYEAEISRDVSALDNQFSIIGCAGTGARPLHEERKVCSRPRPRAYKIWKSAFEVLKTQRKQFFCRLLCVSVCWFDGIFSWLIFFLQPNARNFDGKTVRVKEDDDDMLVRLCAPQLTVFNKNDHN